MASAADATWPPGVRLKTFSALARLNEADTWPQAPTGTVIYCLLTRTPG